MMRAGSWRSLTIATGEIPIVGDSTQQGAANRTLEISADPFDDMREAQAMHHLVAAQHGTAGRAFIEALRRNPRAHPREGALAGIRRDVETGGFPAALRVARRLDRVVPASKAGPVDVEEAGGMRWTEEQDDVLREVSFHGAAFAAAEIARRCGVTHTVRAVEMRASRIHCSLAVQTVCPECGRVGLTLNRQTGLCPLCTERYHLEQERAFNEQLERERAEIEESGELETTRRERNRLRQRNSRLCRKYGLKSRRERKK